MKDYSGNNIAGKKIKLLRRNANISQKALAEALTATGCMMGRDTISRIENGKRYVFDFELLSFARYFNVSFSELTSPPKDLDNMDSQNNSTMTDNSDETLT